MIVIAIVLAACFCQIAITEQLPINFKTCSSKDSLCLKEAIQGALLIFADGIKELGVSPLDPIRVPKLTVNAGRMVQLVQNYENVEYHGLSQSKLNHVSFDLEKGQIIIDFVAPVVNFTGTYEVRGKILVLEVYGKGKVSIRHKNINSKMTMDIRKYDKNGETYLKVINIKLEGQPEHVVYQFDNLFDGNKQLGDNINNVLNDNWKEIYDEVKEEYWITVSKYLTRLTNKFFEKIPMKFLFLD